MPIHVVQAGESLWEIAQRYRVPLDRLAAANGIAEPGRLVPGESLAIPTPERVTVRPGDSLWSLSRLFGVPLPAMAAANPAVAAAALRPGEALALPRARTPIETLGFYIPEGPAADGAAIGEVAPYLTYLALFDYRASTAGDVKPPSPGAAAAIAAARAGGVSPLAAVTNFFGPTFDTEVAHAILSDPAVQGRLLERLVALARAEGLDGVVVDFENMAPADRPLYNAFIARCREALRREGLLLAVAIAPKAADRPTEPWVGAFDYKALGEIVDLAMLMTYEWGWVGGPPMAIAPIPEVQAVLHYATRLISPDKTLMGVPLYGYDWPLPYVPRQLARTLSPEEARDIAVNRWIPINWDHRAQAPWFRYLSAPDDLREVWFEDARSAAAKYDLRASFGLRGAGYWRLGLPFRQHWTLVADSFTVVKRSRPGGAPAGAGGAPAGAGAGPA